MHDRLLSLLVLCAILAGPCGAVASNTPAPTVAFTANPLSIAPGQSSTLIWSATNVDYCMAEGGWSGIWAHEGAYHVYPAATTVYSISCTGAGGTVSQSITVTVTSSGPPPPTLSFSANPTTISLGQSSTLSWSATNVTSCSASGGWSGSKPLSGSQSVMPGATTIYTLACTGPGGTATQSVTVTVTSGGPPPPMVSLTANPATITLGQSSTLSWSATNATSCSASGGWSGSKPVSGSQWVTPGATTTYTLACTGPGGTAKQSATVTISGSSGPTLSFRATPASIPVGQSSNLVWSATNASWCQASDGWTGIWATSGAYSVSPAVTTVYMLTCTGSNGNVTQSVTVTVTSGGPPPPTVSLTANPTTITQGQSSTLSWSATNATSCSASGGWNGSRPVSGSQSVMPSAMTTYTLACTGPGGATTESVTVSVSNLPVIRFMASPAAIGPGQISTLIWDVTNANTCSASGGWSGAKQLSGTQNVSPNVSTVYTLSCTGSGGNATQSVTVTVSAPGTYSGSGPVATWNAYLYKWTDGIYHQALLISNATAAYPVIGYAYYDAACTNLGDTFNDFSQPIGNGLWWFVNHPELRYVQWIWYSDPTDQQILQQTPCIDYSGAPKYN